ncbi:META domain-containing protein, partial [Chloroflexota bacterium]
SIALEDMEWVLVPYGDADNLTMVLEDTEITAVLNSTEGRISGSAGCNNYFAGYEINQNELTLTSPVSSTRMACPEAVMNQEAEYLEILQNIESFDIEDDQLRIVSGDKVLLFEGKIEDNRK